jgi:hypothetical protein
MVQKTQGTQLWYQSAASAVTEVGAVTGITGTGGGADQIDGTNLMSVEKEYTAGLPSPGAVSVPINFDPGNPTHQALYALWQSGEKVKWIIGLSDGTAAPTVASNVFTYPTTRSYFDFEGYISDFPIEVAGNSKLESTMTVQRSGPKNPHWKTP